MAGDKDIQTQDQTHQVQGYSAVVDDYLDCGYYRFGRDNDRMKKKDGLLNTISMIPCHHTR